MRERIVYHLPLIRNLGRTPTSHQQALLPAHRGSRATRTALGRRHQPGGIIPVPSIPRCHPRGGDAVWVNEIYRSFGSRCKSRVIVNHGLVVVVLREGKGETI